MKLGFLFWPILFLFLMGSCTPTPENTESSFGVKPNESSSNKSPIDLSSLKFLKVIQNGVGTQPQVDNLAMLVGDTVSFKAALFDLAGNYLEDVPAVFTISNPHFPSVNLVSVGPVATFTPSRPGTLVINAAYSSTSGSFITTNDSTGLITVTNTQVPHSMIIVSGNNQTGTVNSNLQDLLKVKVEDSFNQPIQGVAITFQVTQGSGAILGANPVYTNASGVAEVLVKLGTIAGGNNNQYRGTVDGHPSLTADFQATAQPGPQHHITFTTLPALNFAGIAFGVQPSVELRDEFNNLIQASGTITMSKSVGAGTLGGTLTASMVNGLATFSNLSYNVPEAGVVLQASNGTVSGLSAPFSVGPAPPGACAVNDAFFLTADGGCKDLSTGFIWSQPSTTLYIWYQVIWDNLLPGSPVMDSYDAGRGNDYVENISNEHCAGYCDNSTSINGTSVSSLAYCKNLDEGGKSDWRVPTKSELTQLQSNGGATHLQGNMARFYHTSSSLTGNREYAFSVRLSDGFLAGVRKWDFWNAGVNSSTGAYPICIRGGTRNPPVSINVLSGPTVMGINQTPHSNFPLEVAIYDALGTRVNASGRTMTISAVSSGSVNGTATAMTDDSGKAVFNNFSLSGTGNITLTISGPGLVSANFTIKVLNETVGSPCKNESASFQTTEGGCKDLLSGLTWGSIGLNLGIWYTTIWDSSLPGSPMPDVHDFQRTNDYAENFSTEDCGSHCDNSTGVNTNSVSTLAYCKSLNEGGKTDWRVPNKAELSSLQANGANTHILGNLSNFLHTSSTDPSNREYAFAIRLTDGLLGRVRKWDFYNATINSSTGAYPICVRGGRATPNAIALVSKPTLIGVGSSPPSPIKVRIMDNTNTVFGSGVTVTLSSGDVTVGGTTTAVTDYQGMATFSSFQLTGATGNVNLIFSSPGMTSLTTSVTLRTGLGSHLCFSESDRFISQYGGCHDVENGLVWSDTSSAANTWHQAVWDSLLPGSPAQDIGDSGRLDDYDPLALYDPGTNLDNSISAYCKNLTEGGYTDWRLPTMSEWNQVVIGNVARTHFSRTIIPNIAGAGPGCYWTSSTLNTDQTKAYYVALNSGVFNSVIKSDSTIANGVNCDGQSSLKNIRVVCVRSYP
jgi:hypothetical protein